MSIWLKRKPRWFHFQCPERYGKTLQEDQTMKNLRQVFVGIIIALVSIGLLLGGFSLSLAEGNSLATPFYSHAFSYLAANLFSTGSWSPSAFITLR